MKLYEEKRTLYGSIYTKVEGTYIDIKMKNNGILIKGTEECTRDGLFIRNATEQRVVLPPIITKAYDLSHKTTIPTYHGEDGSIFFEVERLTEIAFPEVGFYPWFIEKPTIKPINEGKEKTPKGSVLERERDKKVEKHVFINRSGCAYVVVKPADETVLTSLDELKSWYGTDLKLYPYEIISYSTDNVVVVPEWFWDGLFMGNTKKFRLFEENGIKLYIPFLTCQLSGKTISCLGKEDMPKQIEMLNPFFEDKEMIRSLIDEMHA